MLFQGNLNNHISRHILKLWSAMLHIILLHKLCLSQITSSSLFVSFYYFNPTYVIFSLSQSYLFSPKGFDLGRVDCTSQETSTQVTLKKVLFEQAW